VRLSLPVPLDAAIRRGDQLQREGLGQGRSILQVPMEARNVAVGVDRFVPVGSMGVPDDADDLSPHGIDDQTRTGVGSRAVSPERDVSAGTCRCGPSARRRTCPQAPRPTVGRSDGVRLELVRSDASDAAKVVLDAGIVVVGVLPDHETDQVDRSGVLWPRGQGRRKVGDALRRQLVAPSREHRSARLDGLCAAR